MTVQSLIDDLLTIENRSLEVRFFDGASSHSLSDELLVCKPISTGRTVVWIEKKRTPATELQPSEK